ncbi:MAG: hypothetical protein PXZ08_04625 [Actinomycetota bacterium]|nr:hypothetical protein [Actinomycetota bacterium]
MTNAPTDPDEVTFDPGSMPSTSLSAVRAVWYRRPWFMATVGIIVVVAISVITDLPHPVTKAQDASQQNAVIKQINGDTAPCVFALKESFSFYKSEINHTLLAANLPVVRNYLLEDQTVCSFASGPVYDMTNNIQPIKTAAGKEVDHAMAATVKWITYDAVGAIVAIRNYFGTSPFHLSDNKLAQSESALAMDRATINNSINAASSLLGTTLTPINIPRVERLPGT